MNNILNSAIALVAGPRCGSATLINYFVEVHGFNFEYCDVPTNKPKTIYLLRDVANFDYINSPEHVKMNDRMENFIKLAKNDNIHTIALIRNPIQQLLSIYHKVIENGGKFDKISLPVSTPFSKFLDYRRHNGIIHKALIKCDNIIDVDCDFSTTEGLNFKLMKIKNASGNRGVRFFRDHNLLSRTDINTIQKSESYKIYFRTKQQLTPPL